MTLELTCLAWAIVLALVQIALAGQAKTAQYGVRHNVGPRDGPQPPLNKTAARLQRAQDNLLETLPLFAAAVLTATVAQRTGTWSAWGAMLYLAARVVYLPLYAFGVPVLRSLVWLASMAGLLMVMVPLLRG